MSEGEQFESTDAGSSTTYPQQVILSWNFFFTPPHLVFCQAGTLKKGAHVVIKNRPCKVTPCFMCCTQRSPFVRNFGFQIVETSTSKTGKHGHAKIHIVAIDIFNGKKCEDMCPTSHNMSAPNVTREEYQVRQHPVPSTRAVRAVRRSFWTSFVP